MEGKIFILVYYFPPINSAIASGAVKLISETFVWIKKQQKQEIAIYTMYPKSRK